MRKAILDKRLGSGILRGTIVGLSVEPRCDRHGVKRDKLLLAVDVGTRDTFHVDEAWIRSFRGEQKCTGLWVKPDARGDLLRTSTPGRLMWYLQAATVRDLIGKTVRLCPKQNGFLAVIAMADFEAPQG